MTPLGFLERHALDALGWALVHSLWQGALVALCYAAFAAAVRGAAARHLAACAALALMLALPAGTFYLSLRQGASAPSAETVSEGVSDTDAASARERAETRGENLSPQHARESGDEVAAGTSFGEWAAARVGALAPWLACAWAVGVFGLGLRALAGWLALRRLRAAASAVEGAARETLARASARLNLGRAVRLCESALVEVPSVVGFLRPIVLVPASALTGLTPRQLEAVLAHELAHVRRHDYLVNLLQTAAETLLFYHPAARWVSRQARAEREHACDDAAVEATGDALVYARALAALETLRRGAAPAPALALAADGGSLVRRIRRLFAPRAPEPPGARTPAAALALLLVLVGGGVAGARALVPAEEGAGYAPRATQDAPRREVAVTFVNFPGNIHDGARLAEKSGKLLRSLDERGVPAVAFVNEVRLYRADGSQDEARLRVLREWLDAGHELGNETYAHTNLYGTTVEAFKADVVRGEQIMSRLLGERGRRLRYFSYPYLNTGATREAKAAVERFLRERGYEIHPVTVDNMDWLFSRAYAEALQRGDAEGAAAVRAEYVPYMERMFEFFESYSREVVGREFPQVLMLTAGALNADAFDDLAEMLARRGYSFVTMEQATRDEAYKLPDTYTGARGDSWIARWAVTKGLKYKDSQENLPPLMEKYFADFRRQQAQKKRAGEKP